MRSRDLQNTKEESLKGQHYEERELAQKRNLQQGALFQKNGETNNELKFLKESSEDQNRRQPSKESQFRADFVDRSKLPFYYRPVYGISQYTNLNKDLVMYKFEIGEESLVDRGPRNLRVRPSNTDQYDDGIPGVSGRDYPVYSSVPYTRFSCFGKQGLFVDTAARCQVRIISLFTQLTARGKRYNSNLGILSINYGNIL